MRRSVASLAFATFTITGMLVMSSTVGAAQKDEAPPSGDDRAVSYPGNVVAADCGQLWPGTVAVEVDAVVDQSNTYIDITGIPEGTIVSGVIVKGSDGYNKYEESTFEKLPWVGLHAPIAGGSEKPAQISHWFVCGKSDSTTTTPSVPSTTPSTTTTTATTTTTTSSTNTTTTTTDATSVTTTTSAGATTTTVAPVPVDNDDLPDTGSNVGWMILLGAALLLGGGALLTVPRIRAAVLRRF
ncbi:MAG TPA: LPXTG cell wall anchor domain-containing protein [Actinokineospora sp.]|jgi:LPXTG-motif cell wall-anchored protein|nr:LPXTG cell wall anchor domain-containing protein [Actinokineospora sp.]